MADIRINALATTAASTASDDFIAVDGSANGTRKLNAYSPTFGGNLTVSGAINVAGNVLGTSTGNDEWKILRGADTNYSVLTFRDTAGNNEWVIGRRVDSVAGAGNFSFYSTSLGANALTLALVSGNATLAGNLTVSGTAGSWASGVSAIDLSTSATLYGTAADVGLVSNAYYDGAWKRKTANATGRYQFQLGSGDHIWYSAGSGSANSSITFTQAMTLTNSGNLLIGTTSDTGQKLQVKGGTRITDSASASNYITIGSGNDAPYGGNSVVAQTGTLVMGTVAAASLLLYTNATTALTLDSSQNATFAGRIRVNTTTTFDNALTQITVTPNTGADTPLGIKVGTNDDGFTAVTFRNLAGSQGSIAVNSASVSYNTTSDRRLKKDIVAAPSAGSEIDGVRVVSHGWNNSDATVKYGVIAQELAAIFPDAVTKGDDGGEVTKAWSVDYSKLVPALLKEVQALRARVAALENN